MNLKLKLIADATGSQGVVDGDVEALGYSIDSRTLRRGDLFFAVKGDRVDGHDYVSSALSAGAVAAVVSQHWEAPPGIDQARLLRVAGANEVAVTQALQRLARYVRRCWGRRVIGVTGSAGKTTTKECIAQVLSTSKRVLKTEGNLNNHFGVPLTLLRLQDEHEVAVVEMGMNHAGEIADLARIAEPDWGVVSNVGMAHAEFFADGIEGVARAKYELIEALPSDGLAFLNGDDVRVRGFGSGMGNRAVLFGYSEGCSVRGSSVVSRGLEGSEFSVSINESAEEHGVIHLAGSHNVQNALAAIAVGSRSGVPVNAAIAALGLLVPTDKRGVRLDWHGASIFDDSYNSNPEALKAMILSLSETPAMRRILIAGEMLELGPDGALLHRECGEAAAAAGLDIVVGVRGMAYQLVDAARAKETRAEFLDSADQAGRWMHCNLQAGDVVLLKASRGVRLESALDALK